MSVAQMVCRGLGALSFVVMMPQAFSYEVSGGSSSRGVSQAPGNCTLPTSLKGDAKKQCFAKDLNQKALENKGQHSQGKCLQAVRTNVEKAAGSPLASWCEGAADSGNCLLGLGMTKAWAAASKEDRDPNPPPPKLTKKDGKYWSVEWPVFNKGDVPSSCSLPTKLPPGTILVYGGTNRWGHIEVVTDEGLVCSDFCSDGLITDRTRDRWLIGVYLPPPENYSGSCASESPWGPSCKAGS